MDSMCTAKQTKQTEGGWKWMEIHPTKWPKSTKQPVLRYSCRVLQRLIEHCHSNHMSELIEKLLRCQNLSEKCCHCWGLKVEIIQLLGPRSWPNKGYPLHKGQVVKQGFVNSDMIKASNLCDPPKVPLVEHVFLFMLYESKAECIVVALYNCKLFGWVGSIT